MSLVAMKVWMRGRSASRTASPAAATSRSLARASPATITPGTSRATARVASKSPGEEIGKPASSTSTWSRASCCAISTFSRVFRWMPGDCSPSRSVVSKIGDPLGGVVLRYLLVGAHGGILLTKGLRGLGVRRIRTWVSASSP